MRSQKITQTPSDKPNAGDSGFFTLLSASDICDLPEPEWLIDGILPSSGLASIYGPSGVGKTFVCLDLAATVANGSEWFGYQTRQSKVVYIALEGQAGFPRRVRAWTKYHNAPFPNDVRFVFDQFDITNPKHPASLGSLIEDCDGAGLIVIDTLNRSAPGTDENSSSDMGKILAGASALQKATGGMVLLIHHPGKDASRGLRGHSSLLAALDTVIEVDRHGELIRWTSVKVKDDEDGKAHLFKLTPVDLGQSSTRRMLSSCVIEQVEGSIGLQKPKKREGKNQEEILHAVRDILLRHRIQSALDDPLWPNDHSGFPDGFPDGLPYDFILVRIKDTLRDTPTKHRKQRTEEALAGLIDRGLLTLKGELIGLPTSYRVNDLDEPD